MSDDIDYYRTQTAFWHKRTSQEVSLNYKLTKENETFRKRLKELKCMVKFVDLLKEFINEDK